MSLRGVVRRRLWLTLPVLAAFYVLLVLGASRWLGTMRVDLTHDRLYTLSPGTRDILGRLGQPLDLTLYFSDRASHSLPQLRAYHQRVVNMLQEVVRQSHGRVHFAQIDPLPFSDEEDRATAAGLTSARADGTSQPIFFGLTGRNASNGRTSVIPFFMLAKERFLEYDIAKLLYELSTPRKPRVAIYSGLPIWGDPGADGNGAPPWTALQQVQQLFRVQQLDAGSLANLGADVSVLVLIQPIGLSEADVEAVDRYVQGGGHLLAFVDPESEVGGEEPSVLPRLFRAWGVAFDSGHVLLDRSRALSVQSPVTGEPVRHPAVLGLTGDDFNRRDPVTRALNVIDVSSTGFFQLLPQAAVRLDPLIQSTTGAMAVPVSRVREALDPSMLYEGYQPQGEHYAIAVRLRGKLAPAFPDDARNEAPAGARKPEVILVGDTDLLSDRLWVQQSPSQGQTLVSPFANNGDFFVNAIDDLAGPSDLIAIRGRAVDVRKFTRVDALRRQADEKFKAKQLQLQDELTDTEQHLAELKQAAHGRARTAAQKAAVDQFTRRKLAIRTELRAVQRSLDADIERLSVLLKFIDILLMPIVVALAGLLYGLLRTRRRRSVGAWR
ncbi:MAG TPA: Gldg family protein [Rhodanobacteraceae bacterium]|nr:Gldg family protein [Rhodanobacteraceae bacterium]